MLYYHQPRETTENYEKYQGNCCLDQDLNPGSPEYESGMLPIQLQCSVKKTREIKYLPHYGRGAWGGLVVKALRY